MKELSDSEKALLISKIKYYQEGRTVCPSCLNMSLEPTGCESYTGSGSSRTTHREYRCPNCKKYGIWYPPIPKNKASYTPYDLQNYAYYNIILLFLILIAAVTLNYIQPSDEALITFILILLFFGLLCLSPIYFFIVKGWIQRRKSNKKI